MCSSRSDLTLTYHLCCVKPPRHARTWELFWKVDQFPSRVRKVKKASAIQKARMTTDPVLFSEYQTMDQVQKPKKQITLNRHVCRRMKHSRRIKQSSDLKYYSIIVVRRYTCIRELITAKNMITRRIICFITCPHPTVRMCDLLFHLYNLKHRVL